MIEWWNEGAAALLRETMEQRGLSAPQLARNVNVTDRTIRNWMGTTGRLTRPNADNLRDLCATLQMSLDEFRASARAYDARQHVTPDAVPPAPPRASPQRLLLLVAAALVLLAAAAALLLDAGRRRPETFEIAPSVNGLYDRASGGQVSPDGTRIIFLARSLQTQRWMLFVYSLADKTTRAVPRSEGNYTSYFWSNDSRSVLFITDLELMLVHIDGGAPRRIGHAAEALRGTMSGEGVVLLGSRRGLMRIDETGSPVMLTHTAPAEMAHSLPCFLPGGKRVLFTVTKRDVAGHIRRTLAVVPVAGGPIQPLFPVPSSIEYVHGRLLYVRNRRLVARPFDAERLQFTGGEVTLAEPVWADPLTGEPGFSASTSTIIVIPPQQFPPLYHVTHDGSIEQVIVEPADIRQVAVSHHSGQLALVGRGSNSDEIRLWLYVPRTRQRTELTAAQEQPSSPVFSRDDRVLYYAAPRTSWASIYEIPVIPTPGMPRLVIDTKDISAPRDTSPDGRLLLFQRWPVRDGNLWYMPVGNPDNAQPLIATPEDEGESARFSPDGRKIVFVAKRGKEFSVYVTDFPATTPPVRVVDSDGWRARWSEDGKHIYFARRNGVYEADPATHHARLLFTRDGEISILETARDGGFYIREAPVAQNPTVITQWWPRLSRTPLNLSRALH